MDFEENGLTKEGLKKKIDALAWHGRLLKVLPNNCVQDAIILFKKALIPQDQPNVRNAYLKMTEHKSPAIATLTGILKNESMAEKLSHRSPLMSQSQTDFNDSYD